MKIKDIGEQGLLAILQKFCPPEIIGDDGAIIPTHPDKSLVITTDMLVDGVHFSDRTTTPQDAGWRAVAANLSDLAAMGASPLAIAVALSLTPDTPVTWVEQLYQGMTACLQQYNTPIVGGDIVRSPLIALAITAFGEVDSACAIRRSSAQPGNLIVATGPHGASRAGLELLLNPQLETSLTPPERSSLILAHQRPKPRLDVLPILWEIIDSKLLQWGSESKIQIAGMDSSDGLADAIIQICQASNVGAKIERNQISIPTTISRLVSPEKALNWGLYGGEDFELILCLPPEIAQKLVEKLGVGAAIVGNITKNPDILLVDSNGIYPEEELSLTKGFQHF
ncbi:MULTISPECIES: thiamine-phosphate kinase [Kamptonema]|uniref:thiamine-phosphate kinase n=1 Tax=Kamptonema TaxID=1501433 RepID=UPI0001DACF3D|nr:MULTISPECIES: thiamine-phosphate kinase [Kamptonema]CBN56990.1 Thiamine-monophosphate kinase [Kamptonema sp. PCC 6506]